MDGTEDPPGPDIANNWLAACVASWSSFMTPEECVRRMVETWNIDQMKEASKMINACDEKLAELKEKKIVMSESGISSDTAVRLYDKVMVLKNKSVPFYVPFGEMRNVPGFSVAGAEAERGTAVSARLSVVEQRTEDIFNMLKKIERQPLGPAPAVTVTQPPGGSFSSIVTGGGGAGLRQRSGSRSSDLGEPRKRALAEMENNKKKTDNEGFQEQKKKTRSRPKATAGSRTLTGQQAGMAEAAPVDIYIGNTHPRTTTEANLKATLIDIAKDMPDGMQLTEDLVIEDVQCLTKAREGQEFKPWCLNWKVTVPGRFKDHMLRPEAILKGWTTRRYFPPKLRRQEPPETPQNPTKKIALSQMGNDKSGVSGQQLVPPVPGAHFKQ